jgi:hypothetical protein
MKDESMKTAVESGRILSAAGSQVDEQRSSLENDHAFLLDYIPAIPAHCIAHRPSIDREPLSITRSRHKIDIDDAS